MANIRIKDAGREEEREDVPMIKQSSMKRILEDKDRQYKDMRHGLEEKLSKKNMEVGMHVHNEKQYLRMLKERERLTYIVGAVTYLIGGVCGWLIH